MSKTKAQQSEETRGDLIRVARALFAKRGYEGVSTEDLVKRAKVTRGALYHHFPDKRMLFEAAVEAVMRDLHGRLATAGAAAAGDPWRALTLGIDAFLEASQEPEMLRIALQDAPSVLGWARWRELDARYGLGLLQQVLEAAIRAGQIPPQPAPVTAHLLLAALGESALLLARAENPADARAQLRETLNRLLAGIRS